MPEIKVRGEKSARAMAKKLARRAKKIGDLRKPNAQAAAFLLQWVLRNFETEGKLVGGWAPFQRGGRWIKGQGLDTSAKLLQDTRVLMASFHPFFDARTAGIGSELPYSKRHEEGEGVPQRRMLPEHSEVETDLLKIYDRHVKVHTRPLDG